jgi:hypothetical protein
MFTVPLDTQDDVTQRKVLRQYVQFAGDNHDPGFKFKGAQDSSNLEWLRA